MYLNQTLLSHCEDFFNEIANEENNLTLDQRIDNLRAILEKDVDGFTQMSEDQLALITQENLEGVWQAISRKEKNFNPDLELLYDDLIALTENASGYEATQDKEDDEMEVPEWSDEDEYSYVDERD